MSPKDPTNFAILTYAWVLLLAVFAGFVSYMRKLKNRSNKTFNALELVAELSASALAGLITFYLFDALGASHVLTAAFVGIAGHMGGRIITVFEKKFVGKIDGEV